MSRRLAWITVILAAVAVDLGVRFGLRPGFRLSLWVETIVFVLAAAVLLWLYRRAPARSGWRRRLQVVLIASLLLAALRSAIWASGRPVPLANGTVLVLGLVAWASFRFRARTSADRATFAPTSTDD